MPISWITAFKMIPWVDVARAAPGIVKGARQLWKNTSGKPGVSTAPGEPAPTLPLSTEERLLQLESAVAELARENAAAGELIASLAEQNERLVEAVDALRVRTRMLLVFTVVLAVGGVALALR